MNKRKRTLSPVEPMLLTIPDVAVKLGLGRTKVYYLIRNEGLPTVKFGTATRVPIKELELWVTRRIA
ncbi:MAG: helix-turn-helix domain-containing protein [Ktedonobacteraceae bacterium]